ncbi:MAG: hypothetical protein JNN30_12925 [Rhodanobacteraceae bacterium]|nr:hypothetical protein [Rhodanobacteraceae bacterium]
MNARYMKKMTGARMGLLAAFIAVTSPLQAAVLKGEVDGVSLNTNTGKVVISGWACKVGLSEPVQVHVYAENETSPPGTYSTLVAAGDTAWFAAPNEVAACNLTGSQTLRFAFEIPATTEAAFPGRQLRAYGVCITGTSCSGIELRGKPISTNPTVYPPRPYFAYRYANASNPSGWSTGTNYFTTWGCRAPSGGINTIRRLNIAPIGSHTTNTWKDSLHVDFNEYVGDNPVIYFSGGSAFATPTFRLERATFNATTGNWSIAEFDSNYSSPGGISSNDGRKDDYITNVYQQDGWGPFANRSGSVSAIPGVSTTAVSGEYPLIGSGTYGISTIRALQGNSADPNTKSCIHMNPSLFDYDSNGRPRGMMACLWTGNSSSTHPWPTDGCALPGNGGRSTSAHYVYRYNTSNGWQLDPNPVLPADSCATVGTVNHIQSSNQKFLVTRWEGRIDQLDLTTNTVTQGLLDCTASPTVVNFAEASGQSNQIYFIATRPNEYGPANGQQDGIPTHDIYVGFRQ